MDDDALDELYSGDLEGFVGRRNELAKRLRSDGDRDAADKVKALKKPNQPAWALNQLGAKQRKSLLKAGEALREAQEKVVAGDAEPDDLREATDAERTAVSEALGAATALADKADSPLSDPATERARQTLHAVALDADVRAEFESGRLTTDHDPPGLGALSVGAPKPNSKRAKRSKADAKAKKRREEIASAETDAKKLAGRREDAEREVEAARKEAERAQHALERATEELQQATAAAEESEERLAGLREG